MIILISRNKYIDSDFNMFYKQCKQFFDLCQQLLSYTKNNIGVLAICMVSIKMQAIITQHKHHHYSNNRIY